MNTDPLVELDGEEFLEFIGLLEATAERMKGSGGEALSPRGG